MAEQLTNTEDAGATGRPQGPATGHLMGILKAPPSTSNSVTPLSRSPIPAPSHPTPPPELARDLTRDLASNLAREPIAASQTSQIILPVPALALLVRQGATGCLRLRGLGSADPPWSVHLGQGKIHFVGGQGPERDRLAYLLERTGTPLPRPDAGSGSIYEVLQHGWQTGHLGLPQLRELIRLFSQEALVHVLALPQATAQFERAIALDPIVTALSWAELAHPLEEPVAQWRSLRRWLPSPYHQLQLLQPQAFVRNAAPALGALMRNPSQAGQSSQSSQSSPSGPLAILATQPSLYGLAARLNADLLPTATEIARAIRRGEIRALPPTRTAIAADCPAIACLDDDPAVQAQVQQVLSASGYRVVAIGRSPQAFSQLMQTKPALILIDGALARAEGQALAHLLRRSPLLQSCPVIWMDRQGGLGQRVMALRAKASRGRLIHLAKPLEPALLRSIVAAQAIAPPGALPIASPSHQ